MLNKGVISILTLGQKLLWLLQIELWARIPLDLNHIKKLKSHPNNMFCGLLPTACIACHISSHPKCLGMGPGNSVKGDVLLYSFDFRRCLNFKKVCIILIVLRNILAISNLFASDWALASNMDPTAHMRRSPSPALSIGRDGKPLAHMTHHSRPSSRSSSKASSRPNSRGSPFSQVCQLLCSH